MTNNQETINTILIDVLKGVKETGSELYAAGKAGVAQAVDFALQQAPLVVQEFLSWKMAEAIFNCIFFSIVVIILLSLIVWAKKKIKKLHSCDEYIVLYSIIIIFCTMLTIGSTIPIKNNIETIIKIKLAPRVYIIEYVTNRK
jgi:hypothetical protein